MTSNGKQFTVTREMLTAVARDQRWADVFAGISARFSKFAFVLFCFITNHLMAYPLGNSEFCFSRISFVSGNIQILGKISQGTRENTLRDEPRELQQKATQTYRYMPL